MYGSHDMRHIGFPQVNGGQRDPREMGRHKFQLLSCSPSTRLGDRITMLFPIYAISACHI